MRDANIRLSQCISLFPRRHEYSLIRCLHVAVAAVALLAARYGVRVLPALSSITGPIAPQRAGSVFGDNGLLSDSGNTACFLLVRRAVRRNLRSAAVDGGLLLLGHEAVIHTARPIKTSPLQSFGPFCGTQGRFLLLRGRRRWQALSTLCLGVCSSYCPPWPLY